MEYLGVKFDLKNVPALDPGFIPFGVWMDAYLKDAKMPIAIAVERQEGQISVRKTFIHGTKEMADADYRYVERYMKFLLWSIGGFKVYVCGCSEIAKKLQADYSFDGVRAFDCDVFQKLYEKELTILDLPLDACPASNEAPKPLGGHMDGCRIGFDAGGSDRKVSAVIDGECVYSEEVVWHPKVNPDPTYQYEGILDSFRTAASKMPRVDAIGVSSAGVFVGNAPMLSSIFYCVPRDRWDEVKTVFDRAAAEIGDVPIVVANDGEHHIGEIDRLGQRIRQCLIRAFHVVNNDRNRFPVYLPHLCEHPRLVFKRTHDLAGLLYERKIPRKVYKQFVSYCTVNLCHFPAHAFKESRIHSPTPPNSRVTSIAFVLLSSPI